MATSNRTPPRFVPTLTAVVEVQPEAPAAVPAPAPAAEPPYSTPVGEGGNMIDDLHFAPLNRAPLPPAGTAAVQISEEDAFRLEEELLHRVLQRVDLSLEERLTDTVSAAVQRQLDAMMPVLRSEIETVLRSLVVEALAQELSETPGSAPPLRPPSLG